LNSLQYVWLLSLALALLFVLIKYKNISFLSTFFLFVIFLGYSFRSDFLNDDTENYKFYFDNISFVDNIFTDLLYAKIEIGFKFLLLLINKIFNGTQNTIYYKIVLSFFNFFLFLQLKSKHQKIGFQYFHIFLFFYFSIFSFFLDLAIIRFSMGLLIMLIACNYLFYQNNNKKYFLFFFFSLLFHYSFILIGLIIYYYYYVFFYAKKKYFYFLYLLPIIMILISINLLKNYAILFGDYYDNLMNDGDAKTSVRIFVDFFLIISTYLINRNNLKFKYKLQLIITLFAYFSLLEILLGVEVFNRMRIFIMVLYFYNLAVEWQQLNIVTKISNFSYAILFYVINCFTLLSIWN
jgi:hypothetical protein